MPGSLAELYGALLKQEPQGVLGAARFNPLMMEKALRQQQANPRPSLASLMNYPQTWQQFGDNIQANYPTDSPAAVRQAAFEAAKNAGPLMTVYHGSPHRFDAFDSSKIGTGEGAQAYGHGLYFAENPAVAKEYQKSLSSKYPISHSGVIEENGKYLAWAKPIDGADVQVIHTDATERGARKVLKQYMADKRGAVYKVDLPDDQIAKMLDWDKPLSQQPEVLKKIFDNGLQHGLYRQSSSKNIGDFTGADLVRSLGNGARASDELRALGIPGIRYLDQGSRGAGSGTSNFVVFPGNEGALKILARE